MPPIAHTVLPADSAMLSLASAGYEISIGERNCDDNFVLAAKNPGVSTRQEMKRDERKN
jgi:hypothetical protein